MDLTEGTATTNLPQEAILANLAVSHPDHPGELEKNGKHQEISSSRDHSDRSYGEGMREYLADSLRVRSVRLLLADYRMSGLSPVLDDAERSAVSLAETSALSRCFASQRLLLDEGPAGVCTAQVPVSVWSDRVGVLVVELPGPPDQPTLAELTRVADELAVTLIAAGQCRHESAGQFGLPETGRGLDSSTRLVSVSMMAVQHCHHNGRAGAQHQYGPNQPR